MKSTENHQSTYLSFRFELSGCVFMSCLVYFQEQFLFYFIKFSPFNRHLLFYEYLALFLIYSVLDPLNLDTDLFAYVKQK